MAKENIQQPASGGVFLTSDWHCGLSLRGTSREEEIGNVLDDLVEKAIRLQPSAVVVAGDLSDTFRYPGSAPSKQIGKTLFKLAEEIPDVRVFVILGNHDWDGLDILALSEKSNIHFIKQPAAIEVFKNTYMVAVPYLKKHNLGSGTYDSIINDIVDNIPKGKRCFAAIHAALEGTLLIRTEAAVNESLVSERVENIFLGHIHTHRQINDRTYYTGALVRNTFGEEKEVSGAWYMDRDFNVHDIPLEGARKLETVHITDIADVLNGNLEEKLTNAISKDNNVMIRLRIPSGSSASEYVAEATKHVEEKLSEPGYNVIFSDFSIPKVEKEQVQLDNIIENRNISTSEAKNVAEQISIKSLWSSYCKERLTLAGASAEDIAIADICGEALLSGTEPAEIWKAMKDGRFDEIRQELEDKENEGYEPVPVPVTIPEKSQEPFMLEAEDLEEIDLNIDI